MERIKKIDRAELILVRIPLIRSFRTSFAVQTHRNALLLHLYFGDMEGWGECVTAPDPYYAYETNETARHIIKDFLMPLIRTLKQFTVEEALDAFARVRGHTMAKATVENALLDLAARKADRPLYEILGGEPKRIMSGISIGIKDDIDELLGIIQEAQDKKYGRIKMKIKKGKDIQMLQAVRETFPDIQLMADANADYSESDGDHLRKFDVFNLMMIEQPLNYDDIYLHSFLQKQIETSICLDESIKSLENAREAVELGSCRIINIKQGRVGGMLKARDIQNYCFEQNIPVWSGGMMETGIGRAFNIHLQTLPGFILPGDTSETSRYFEEDIVDRPVVLDSEGMIEIPEGPGMGVNVVPDQLERMKVTKESV